MEDALLGKECNSSPKDETKGEMELSFEQYAAGMKWNCKTRKTIYKNRYRIG